MFITIRTDASDSLRGPTAHSLPVGNQLSRRNPLEP